MKKLVAASILSFTCILPHSIVAQTPDSAFAVSRSGNSLLRVDIKGGAVFGGTYDTGASNSIPRESAGTRMMWYPGKAAFRAGGINGTQWDDANIGLYSTAHGQDVRASGDNSFASGLRATAANVGAIALGEDVIATGANSVVLGYRASSSTGGGSPRLGSFVFGDRSTSATGDTLRASQTNAAFWRVSNGFYIYTASNLSTGVTFQSGSLTTSPWCNITNAMISASNCAYLSGGGTWTNSSDRNRKHNFDVVSGENVLAKLRSVPIMTWTYNSDADDVKHLGPTAQDFHSAFGLGGSDDTHIATIDADGVALAAAKALDARTIDLQSKIDSQAREIAELKVRLDQLERLIKGKQ